MKKHFVLFILLSCVVGCKGTKDQSDSSAAAAPPTASGPSPTATTPPPSEASAQTDHQVGNGGGGVCIAGSCLTLAEAGLRIPGPSEEYYILTPRMIESVQKLLLRLPLESYRSSYLQSIVGNGKTFRVLDIADQDKLEVIRRRYAAVLSQHQSNIDMRDVKIFAFAGGASHADITYLLPDFFQLSEIQQAKILVHEHNVRSLQFRDDFSKALEFDGMLEDLLEDPAKLMSSQFRLDRWEELVGHFCKMHGFRYSSHLHWLTWLKLNKGLIFETAFYCLPSSPNSFCSPDSKKIFSMYEVPPAFIRAMDSWDDPLRNQFFFDGNTSLSESEIVQACKDKLKDGKYTSFLYPYQTPSQEYKLARIACLMKDQELNYSAENANPSPF